MRTFIRTITLVFLWIIAIGLLGQISPTLGAIGIAATIVWAFIPHKKGG